LVPCLLFLLFQYHCSFVCL